ncbi:MAG: YdiU family protein [Lautropia sp.]|nr:YdiU family protein [Lautropia sp.]
MKPAALHWNLSHSYRTLPPMFFSEGRPACFPDPQVVLFNRSLARELGLLAAEDTTGTLQTGAPLDAGASKVPGARPQRQTTEPDDGALMAEAAAFFSGNRFPEGAEPIAQAYAGHQFGHFAMLGDGRATLIGEQITPDGQRIDIQLKGNGQTPYSRRGDGKAALGPMLREYLISEAMHALHIPTTRSLAVVTTGETIYRSSLLTGAVLTRTAQSHIRVATFQFAAALRDADTLKALADYAIERHFPEISNAGTDDASNQTTAAPNPYLQLLGKVIERQIALVARWQAVGFIHGVMNTDNMAIAGETIDYGPCAFMDTYDPDTVFSSIDHQGRYRYSNQPPIAHWNLTRFAETLLPLFSEDQDEAIRIANEALQAFGERFDAVYQQEMARKLGLFPRHAATTQPDGADAVTDLDSDDAILIADLLTQMHAYSADYTNTFVRLTLEADGRDGAYLDGTETLFSAGAFGAWKTRWLTRIDGQTRGRQAAAALMKSVNPAVIPRNLRVEEALEAAEGGNLQPFKALLAVLQRPFDHEADVRPWQAVPKNSRGYQTFCGT